MKRSPGFLMAPLALAAMVGLAGCGGASTPTTNNASEEEHAHPEEGPHHGHLIELGDEEYHAELTHDDATGAITVYLLDKNAESPVAIDAAQIMLNLAAETGPMQVALTADPQDAYTEGQASRFSAADATALEALESEETKGRLNVTISGKSYAGAVDHAVHGDHEHGDHEHEHEHD